MSKTYNLENINELSGGDNEFIIVLVQTFLEEIPPDIESMVNAINSDNSQVAYQFAHKMKPNLQLFGIDLLSQIKKVEAWSRSDKGKEVIKPTLDHIVATVNKAIVELKADFK